MAERMTTITCYRGIMWADNYGLFCDNGDGLVCLVNDMIVEFLGLDMEHKPEMLSWTSTYKDRDALRVGSRGKTWDLPFSEVFDVLGYRFHRDGRGVKAPNGRCVRAGQLVPGQVHLSFKECAHACKMSEGPQPRQQYCP